MTESGEKIVKTLPAQEVQRRERLIFQIRWRMNDLASGAEFCRMLESLLTPAELEKVNNPPAVERNNVNGHMQISQPPTG